MFGSITFGAAVLAVSAVSVSAVPTLVLDDGGFTRT
jgi:hypothetical protein